MNKKQLFLIILVVFLISGCFQQEKLPNHDKWYGNSEMKLQYKKHYYMNVCYPQGKVKQLNKEIKKIVLKEQTNFLDKMKHYKEKRKAEFNVKYDSFIKENRYLTIQLKFYETIYHSHQFIKTIHYDLKKKDFFELSNIMKGDYLSFISKLATHYFETNFFEEINQTSFKIAIAPLVRHYQNFSLKDEAIEFYFEPHTIFDEAASFSLTYEKLHDYTTLKQASKAVFVPYRQVLNLPITNIDPDKPMVALSFDDGPTRTYTTAILDCLKENNSVATFYVLGSRVNAAPDLLQRMVIEGSEIGNHTYHHLQLTTLSKRVMLEEIKMSQDAIYEITNQYPKTIRPPYGARNEILMSCIGNQRIVTWTLDSEDWRSKNTKTIVDKVMNSVKDKDIILMHDLYPTSAQAAIILIPELIEAGYQLVNISQLYEYSKDHQYIK
ncbi:MAG: polysaccharide deacetylase family protein [Erysipelotrichaceae bacterium]